MFPLFLNLTDKLAVVVGAGPVGRRKTQTLLDAGAKVRVICLEKVEEAFHVQRTRIIESYNAHHLDGASLVFAAANPALNQQIVSDAKARGIWVNSADDSDDGDFILPATLNCGALQIAVSTGGIAPSLAQRIRDHLVPQFDQVFADWLTLLAEFRPIILESIDDSTRRNDLFHRLTEWDWLDSIRRLGLESARVAVQSMVDEAAKR